MATLKRRQRVAEQIHQEIGKALQFEIKDPRIGFVTVTGVEINSDLTLATVFISLFDENETGPNLEQEALLGLESAKPYLKHLLGQKIKMRQLPDLSFKIDRSLAYASRIETLLSQLDIPPEIEDATESGDHSDEPLP